MASGTINAIVSRNSLSSLFAWKTFEKSGVSINGQDSTIITWTDMGYDCPSGYEPFAIRGFKCGNTKVVFSRIKLDPSDNYAIIAYNGATSAVSSTKIIIDVIFIKTGYMSEITT